MVILKKFQDMYNDSSIVLDDEIYNYAKKLENQGWMNSMIEGGYISPDLSTIYYYNRYPYTGQLLQFRPNKEKEYRTIVESLKEKEDFIELEVGR